MEAAGARHPGECSLYSTQIAKRVIDHYIHVESILETKSSSLALTSFIMIINVPECKQLD